MGTTTDKLNRLTQTKSDLKTVINYAGADINNNTAFKNYPKLLHKSYIDILNNGTDNLYESLPKETGSGTSLDLDTEEGKMKIGVNSTALTQNSTPTPDNPVNVNVITGSNNIKIQNKNFFDYTQIPDAPPLEGFQNSKKLTFKVKPNTKYTLSSNVPQDNNTLLYFNGTSTATNGVWLNNPKTMTSDSNGELFVATFTNRPYYNDIVNNTYYIQLEEGTTATTYIPHQEQNYPITLSSNNLFDFDNIVVSRLGNDGTVNVENNIITFTATGQSVYGVTIDLADLNLKNNTTYTVSNLFTNTGTFANNNGWRYYNGSSYTTLNKYQTYFTFTTTESGTNQLLYYVGSPITYTGTLKLYNIQLLEGNITQANIPNYLPYIANPIKYCKIGDYADQIFKNTADSPYYDNTLIEGDCYLKKNIEQVILNGSEDDSYDYTSDSSSTNLLAININPNKVTASAYKIVAIGNWVFCDKFPYIHSTIANAERVYISSSVNISDDKYYGNIRLYISHDRLNGYSSSLTNDEKINLIKTWLQSNPLIVYYVTRYPQNVHITTEDYPILLSQLENIYNNVKSYKDKTYINQTNENLPFNIEISALKVIE